MLMISLDWIHCEYYVGTAAVPPTDTEFRTDTYFGNNVDAIHIAFHLKLIFQVLQLEISFSLSSSSVA